MAVFLKYVSKSREQLRQLLRKNKNFECPETRFVDRSGGRVSNRIKDVVHLKFSPLGWRFHLFDMIGSGFVERISSGNGQYFIRLHE